MVNKYRVCVCGGGVGGAHLYVTGTNIKFVSWIRFLDICAKF